MSRIILIISVIVFIAIATLSCGGGGSGGGGSSRSILSLVKTVSLENAEIWGGISYDGTHINITTMYKNQIYLKKFDTNLVETAEAVQLTFSSELPGAQDQIADHKHLYLNGSIYVTYSLSGDEYLYLFKVNTYGTREGDLVTVVASSELMTNDMHLVSDGDYIYIMIGEGDPAKNKKVYKYDLDLNYVTTLLLTTEARFSPLSSTVYKDNKFYTFGGNFDNHNLILTMWNSSWESPSQVTLITGVNEEWNYFATGSIFDSTNNRWYIAYSHFSPDQDADTEQSIYLAAFDADFNTLQNQKVTGDQGYQRGHLLLLDGYLYMVYDGRGGVFLSKYSVLSGS